MVLKKDLEQGIFMLNDNNKLLQIEVQSHMDTIHSLHEALNKRDAVTIEKELQYARQSAELSGLKAYNTTLQRENAELKVIINQEVFTSNN